MYNQHKDTRYFKNNSHFNVKHTNNSNFSWILASLRRDWYLFTVWLTCHRNLCSNPGLASLAWGSTVIMSSPDGLQYSQADFLARWMPSSTRAGVILHPLPDLAGSLRHTPQFLRPDDSFSSDFAPLPISADSSCLAVDGAARKDVPLNALCSVPPDNSDGELDSLDEMTSKSKDLPLILKLEEVRTASKAVCLLFITHYSSWTSLTVQQTLITAESPYLILWCVLLRHGETNENASAGMFSLAI